MSKRDYYNVLGVSRTVDADTLKREYRTLARKWHPDVNKSDNAQEKFSEIQEAYDVLSDPEKRRQYDRFGHVGVGAGSGGPGGGAGSPWAWEGGGGGGGPFGQGGGRSGGADMGSIFEELFGGGRQGARGGNRPHASPPSPPAKGESLHHTIQITFNTAAVGGTEQIRLKVGDAMEVIDVTIPAGINHGDKMRVRGKGHPGQRGGETGDMILTIHVGKHPWFRRDGLDILLDLPLTIAEAVMGLVVTVPTMNGNVSLRIPPGAQGGQKMRISGHGIQKSESVQGDFYAILKVETPDDLCPDDARYFEDLTNRLTSKRTGAPWDDLG